MSAAADMFFNYAVQKNNNICSEYIEHTSDHNLTLFQKLLLIIRLNLRHRIFRRTSAEELYAKYPDNTESSSSRHISADELVSRLSEYNTVSFDVFDTLIVRPLPKPTDVFAVIEDQYNAPGFSEARKTAETVARRKSIKNHGHSEITIHDIYTELKEYNISEHDEINTELYLCQPNPYMQKVYNAIKDTGKRVILTTDMYLPQTALVQILEKCGYIGYSDLLLSCENSCSKFDGGLYKLLLDLAGPASNIVHIGDNATSDVVAADKAGIHTIYYKGCHSTGNMYRPQGIRSIGGKLACGIINIRFHCSDEILTAPYEYGYAYIAPYCISSDSDPAKLTAEWVPDISLDDDQYAQLMAGYSDFLSDYNRYDCGKIPNKEISFLRERILRSINKGSNMV